MIVDKAENLNLYTHLGAKFQKGFNFILDPELMLLDNGRYEIDGDNVYALVSEYKTKVESEGKLESHKKYIDIQFLAKGNELIGYTPFNNQELITEYDEAKDFQLFNGDKFFINLHQGMFAVFFPYELHMPGIISSKQTYVKKVVIKVKA
jgi:YhcH/YjgK/YiaL family protein